MLQLEWPICCSQSLQCVGCDVEKFVVYPAEACHELFTATDRSAIIPDMQCQHVAGEAVGMEFLEAQNQHLLLIRRLDVDVPLLLGALTLRGRDVGPIREPRLEWHLVCGLDCQHVV